MSDYRADGKKAEEKAKQFLLDKGLIWVASNVYARCGEIDLIMKDKAILVFVEVRSRAQKGLCGGGLESIHWHKQNRIKRTAMWYMQKHRIYDKVFARFDVVVIEGTPLSMSWIKNAF